jgi:hypothetical protein
VNSSLIFPKEASRLPPVELHAWRGITQSPRGDWIAVCQRTSVQSNPTQASQSPATPLVRVGFSLRFD